MLLWFVATAVLTVHVVFSDPRFDHRWLIAGVLAPDLIDVWFGGARVMHSVTGAVAVMVVVMVATAGRKPIRKQLLALPIGIMLHLVFDAAWDDTTVFWWPFAGGFDDTPLPVVQRGWWNVPLEAVGAVLLVVAWKRFGLADPARRAEFARTGRLAEAPPRQG